MSQYEYKGYDLDEAMAMSTDDLLIKLEIPAYGDRIHKYLIDMNNDEGKELAVHLIEGACKVEIEDLQPLEREQNTDNDETKKNIFDNHCRIISIKGQETRICIETQRSLQRNSFTDKVNFNHSSLVVHSINKSTKDGEIPNIDTILLYEGQIIDDDNSDLIVEMKLGTNQTDNHYDRKKSKVLCVQLGKMAKIAREKGIDNLSLFEAMCYFIRYRHLKKYKKNIQKLIQKYKEVRLMEKRYMDYLDSPINRYETLREEMEHMFIESDKAESNEIAKKENAAMIAVHQLQIKLGGLLKETVELIYASELENILCLTYSIFTIQSEQDVIDILTVIN